MKGHWVEYGSEALCLALFMASATGFATLLQHPASPLSASLSAWTASSVLMRAPMGLAMGLTAVALIYSPFGRRSGAHMNPAVTLAFACLGRVGWRDAVGYTAGQFVGGGVGLVAAVWLLRGLPADPSVNYVATTPGPSGASAAFMAEALISCLMMSTVLAVSARPSVARFTGLAAGSLVVLFITFEAPYSGMSMNPARTFTANLLASRTAELWIYFAAPVVGMLGAALGFARLAPHPAGHCAKLDHPSDVPCIFCGQGLEATATAGACVPRSSTESLP